MAITQKQNQQRDRVVKKALINIEIIEVGQVSGGGTNWNLTKMADRSFSVDFFGCSRFTLHKCA